MIAPPSNRNIEDLNPIFKQKLKLFLAEMQNIDPMNAHETLRTQERQDYLIATRKSFVQRSNHQDGIAADLHFTTPPNFPPAGDFRWRRAAEIAKKHGIDCGGILWNWDWNHFQDDGSSPQTTINNKNWTEEARDWVMKNNISNGERPGDNLTRVELWETLRKYSENYLKK